jgi:hypothetical protein
VERTVGDCCTVIACALQTLLCGHLHAWWAESLGVVTACVPAYSFAWHVSRYTTYSHCNLCRWWCVAAAIFPVLHSDAPVGFTAVVAYLPTSVLWWPAGQGQSEKQARVAPREAATSARVAGRETTEDGQERSGPMQEGPRC